VTIITETTDAAGGTTTTYALQIGDEAQGQLSTSDHDWYRINLVSGQTYSIVLTGIGANNCTDTYLRLYDSTGSSLLSSDDDGLPGLNSLITFTASSTGTYYIDAAGYGSSNTGTYAVSVTSGSRASLDYFMGAGVIDTDQSWSTPGNGATVTFGFRQTSNGEQATFSQVTSAQKTAIQAILAAYAEMLNVTFTAVNPSGYTDNATILFSDYSANDGAGAYAYYPGSTAASSSDGDVWLNTSVSTSSLPIGSYSYFAIMHEVGHALGLSHPGLYNAAVGVSITYANDAQFTQDSHQYTIMSYFAETYTGANFGGYADTPMLYDIYALQQIYGANAATRSGDNIYGFNCNVGGVYDFTSNTTPALCIWDGGGTDMLDMSGSSAAQTISLVAGTFSSVVGGTSNISIAYGATIENATGGSGADTIYGNSVANTLQGGNGNDTLYGEDGDDTLLHGNLGNDTVYGGNGNDTIRGGQGDDVLLHGNLGNDIIYGDLGNDYIRGGQGDDVLLHGNVGNDTIYGDLGNDYIRGGQDNDTIFGGADNDTIWGDLGSDIIYGDAGYDYAYFAGNVSAYSVTNYQNGSWIIVEMATGYTDNLYGIEQVVFDNGYFLA